MKYLKKFNESDVYDMIDDMVKDEDVIKYIGGVPQFDKIYRQISDKWDNVSQGDLDFISRLFKDDLILNETIFYKKNIDYKEYDDTDSGWRQEDWRGYKKWKNSKNKDPKEHQNVDGIPKDANYFPFKLLRPVRDYDFTAFSKYQDNWWMVMVLIDGEYRHWLCDDRDGLKAFKNLNIYP